MSDREKSLKCCSKNSKNTDYFLSHLRFRLENYYEGSPFGNNKVTIIG